MTTSQGEWPLVLSTKGFVEKLQGVRDAAYGSPHEPALLFVYVSWKGCLACAGGSEFHDELALLPSYEGVPSGSRFVEIPWFVALRIATMQPEDEHDIDNLPTERLWSRTMNPDAYKAFFEMTSRLKQVLGCNRPVQAYPQPPENRPHFPQLMVISGARLAAAHPPGVSGLDDLAQVVEEFLTRGYFFSSGMGPDDVELLRKTLSDCLLVQLVNENLFKESDVGFMKSEFQKTVKCLIDCERAGASGPQDCVAYWRPGTAPISATS